MSNPILEAKGEKNGRCNRSSCLSPHNVIFYNYSTRKYYCPRCASLINEVNHADAIQMFGHELCMKEED